MDTLNDKEYMQAWILSLALLFSVGFLGSLIYVDHIRQEPTCVSNTQRADAGILMDTSHLTAIRDCWYPHSS